MKVVINHEETLSRQKEMMRLREEGKTFRAIGNIYGISRQRVKQILDYDYNLTNHNFGKKQSEKIEREVIYKELKQKLLKSHLSIFKMSKDLNIPYTTLCEKLSGKTKMTIEEYDEYLDYLDRFARTYRKEYEYANRRH